MSSRGFYYLKIALLPKTERVCLSVYIFVALQVFVQLFDLSSADKIILAAAACIFKA